MGEFSWGKSAAIILAAGNGTRMGQAIKKQFILVGGKPLLYYSIKAFCDVGIGRIILVAAKEDFAYCREQWIASSEFGCQIHLAEGGRERYDSVYAGLLQAEGFEYVFIHDGARACLEQDVLRRTAECVEAYQACAAAVPVKDTIKIADGDGFAVETPERSRLWAVQTPQAFRYDIVMEAYRRMAQAPKEGIVITDDAMVVEHYSEYSVKMAEGSYRNIKVTTKEDLAVAACYLSAIWEKKEKK